MTSRIPIEGKSIKYNNRRRPEMVGMDYHNKNTRK